MVTAGSVEKCLKETFQHKKTSLLEKEKHEKHLKKRNYFI